MTLSLLFNNSTDAPFKSCLVNLSKTTPLILPLHGEGTPKD